MRYACPVRGVRCVNTVAAHDRRPQTPREDPRRFWVGRGNALNTKPDPSSIISYISSIPRRVHSARFPRCAFR
jgi:hypothetical protein